uniref:Leucine-rich repeat-containing protein 7 n=1 Tax=Poecilia latipinna TaxID=48699 RepID=A0A3B3VJW9_9TELE
MNIFWNKCVKLNISHLLFFTVQCLEMTTKRKLIGRLVPCRCFRGEEEVISVLDYSHCSLQQVPKEIFSFERTLEELYLDANQIEELPKQLFQCQALKKLSLPDNDLSNLPTTIASLVNLKELDISKNGIQEFPDNIKCCKGLSVVEASVNPITKLPDGFTQLLNLTQLFLNDAFLEYLPANFGRLSKLRILELRENHLKTMPNLKELWLDNNSLQSIPGSIGKLRQLRYLDLAKNRIETLDSDISGCEALEDLLLSSNMLQHLPDSIGMLKKLTTLKVDDNQLTSLPHTIGSLSLLEELDCSCNELESLPPTVGYLHSLRTFAADENFLTQLPREIGNCKNVTVMSLRSNKLEFLPDEIGQMTKLRVLNLSDNRLKNLPFTFTKLKDLAALWLSDNQSKALIPLQTEAHPETKQKVLTNYMFPQQPRHDEDYQSDSDSFNPTLWEEQRQQRMTVAFDFEDKKDEEDNSGKVKVPGCPKCGSGATCGPWTDFLAAKTVEINLKRYPTPYPEDLKNMVKSVQSLVGKSMHPGHGHQHQLSSGTATSAGTNMEHAHLSKEQYEPPWPLPPKEDSMGGSPNDIRISDMRPTLVEPQMYKPKVVLLGKDKKESTDEEVDKLHCLNHSGSSATYSDYSPSQGSSGSSNPSANTHSHTHSHAHAHTPALPSFPKPIDSKPLLSQRETPPSGTLQQRGDRRPLSEPFDWSEAQHYDNTGFDAEESPMDPTSSNTSQGNPPLGSKPRSQSAHGRRPLLRQDRIVGVPLELDTQTLPYHGNQRSTPDNDPQSSGPSSQNPWQNWTRTPSPLEDRTAFPSKLDLTPTSSPNPDRKDMDSRLEQGSGPLPGSWTYHNSQGEQIRKDQLTVSGGNKVTVVMSKSSDRLSPMMKETRSKFKKSQSIDEIDIGSYKVYSIPMESYSSSIEQQTSLDRPELPGSMEQTSMSRSQSAPMLDDELGFLGHGGGNQNQSGQNQKPAIPHKAYHFDQNYNPQVRNVTIDRRIPPPFPNTPDYVNHSSKAMDYLSQPGKTLPKELVSPRYRAYPPLEMFSFPQAPINQDGPSSQQQQTISTRSRPGFLRRADSLVSSTELALFRRVHEAQQEALQETDPPHYSRALAYSSPMEHSALTNMSDNQNQMMHNKRNGRYDDDYTTYQEQKKPMIGYPTKSLTQRRPLSARSYSTETYGASQARPVSARPTMAALLEKMPPDYTLATCPEKPSEDTIKVRPVVSQKPEDITSKMPADWRQQLLRHIEAKRLDRTPSQQAAMLDNDQEGVTGSNQWAPYSLGRRDVPPENLMKKVDKSVNVNPVNSDMRKVKPENPDSVIGGLVVPDSRRSAAPRVCLLSAVFAVRAFHFQLIEKNPGLGFSISGGISGQGNPFKPSDMGIFVTRVQHDGPAASSLKPGDKILQANGHSFLHMEHETAVSLLKSFPRTVHLVVLRDGSTR